VGVAGGGHFGLATAEVRACFAALPGVAGRCGRWLWSRARAGEASLGTAEAAFRGPKEQLSATPAAPVLNLASPQ
jgi:hypothetical protein